MFYYPEAPTVQQVYITGGGLRFEDFYYSWAQRVPVGSIVGQLAKAERPACGGVVGSEDKADWMVNEQV